MGGRKLAPPPAAVCHLRGVLEPFSHYDRTKMEIEHAAGANDVTAKLSGILESAQGLNCDIRRKTLPHRADEYRIAFSGKNLQW
jgi:hypothetical protein